MFLRGQGFISRLPVGNRPPHFSNKYIKPTQLYAKFLQFFFYLEFYIYIFFFHAYWAKAISHPVTSPTHASLAATGDTGVQSAVQVMLTDKQDRVAPEYTIGRPGSSKIITTTMEENENALSEDESLVFEVQFIDSKGETASEIKSFVPGCRDDFSVRGRLKEHIWFWERIEAPEYILETIRSGCRIPFLVDPPYHYKRNNNLSYLHNEFVSDAIRELLEEKGH